MSSRKRRAETTCPACSVTFSSSASFGQHVRSCVEIPRLNAVNQLRHGGGVGGIHNASAPPADRMNLTMRSHRLLLQPTQNAIIHSYNQLNNMENRHQQVMSYYAQNMMQTQMHQGPNNTNNEEKDEEENDDEDDEINFDNSGGDTYQSDDGYGDGEEGEVEESSSITTEQVGNDESVNNDELMSGPNPTFPARNDSEGIKFRGLLAPSSAAGLQLVNKLGSKVPKSVYNNVVQWVNELSSQNYDFSQPIPERKQLQTICRKTFKLEGLQPTIVRVPVKTMTEAYANVPVFNMKVVLERMLCDPNLMKEENIAEGYDLFTGKPKHDASTVYYDEVHSGRRWEEARKRFCGENEKAFPCGLIIFYDKSVADRNGALATSPLMFTCSFFSKKCRGNHEFYDLMGYIPNLDYRAPKSHSIKVAQSASAADKCQDEHYCLFAALKQLQDIIKDGGLPLTIRGKDVIVRPWIHFLIGDISGNNVLHASFNSSQAKRPYRACKCPMTTFTDPNYECERWTWTEINSMKANRDVEALKDASKHNIVNVFDSLPMSDSIIHCTPPETLHAIAAGIVKYCVGVMGQTLKGKEPIQAMHTLHLLLADSHSLQSERDMPRPSKRNLFLDTTKIQAHEIMGNFHLLLCAMHTITGISACDAAGIDVRSRNGKIKTIKMLLALEKWINRRSRKSIVDDQTKIRLFIRRVIIPSLEQHFPRGDGNGWRIPKVHSLIHFPYYIAEFGSGHNFNGCFGESNLKHFMKNYTSQTQRRPGSYSNQLADVHHDNVIFGHSLNAIQAQLDGKFESVTDKSGKERFSGEHTIVFRKDNGTVNIDSMKFNMQVDWRTNVSGSNKQVDSTLEYAVKKLLAPHCNHFEIKAYNAARLPNAKEAVESYLAIESDSLYQIDASKDRHDWCMILTHELNLDEDDQREDKMKYMCPGRIHGFIRFVTPGLPTPLLVHKEGDKDEDIRRIANQRLTDDNVYVVVRTHKDFLSWRKLEEEFICPIDLDDVDKYTYIFPIDRIVHPLYVFKNHGHTNDNAFFACLPGRYWAFYIDHCLTRQCRGCNKFFDSSLLLQNHLEGCQQWNLLPPRQRMVEGTSDALSQQF